MAAWHRVANLGWRRPQSLPLQQTYRVNPNLSAPQSNPESTRLPVLSWLTAAHVWSIFGLALSSGLLGFAWLGSVAAIGRQGGLARLQEVWRSSKALLIPVAVYLTAYGVSVATSVHPRDSLREFASTVFTMSALILLLLWVRGERRTRWMLQGVLMTIGLFSIWGIVQYVFTDQGPVSNRIPGPFSHYMTFSGVLLVGVVILLARLGVESRLRTLPNWLLLGLITLAMVLTLTRHVWVATVAAVTLVVWMMARRWTPVYLAALLVSCLALAACAPEQWDRARSIVDLDNASNYDRLCMTWSGAQMIKDRPFFGMGPGSVTTMYPLYRHPTAPRVEIRHLHNTFVNMAAERGLIELGAFIWLLFVVGREGLRGYHAQRERSSGTADLYFTAFLLVVVFSFAGMFEANWRDTEVNRLMLFVMVIPWLLKPSTMQAQETGQARTG